MKFRGSAQIGLTRIRWPFTPTLTLDENGIRLDGLLAFQLKKSEVKRLEYSGGLFSQGVRIVHSNPSVDSTIRFSPAKPLQMLSLARGLGYETISTEKY